MLSAFPYWFLAAIAVALGLSFGSFLNVVIHRLPRGENLAHPGSRCPGCGARIRARHNVPVLSWLLLRGRARCCRIPISPRYPLVELLGGLAGWAVLEKVLAVGDGPHAWTPLALFALYLALVLGLVAAIFIDLEFMLLPDAITLGGAVLGVLSAPVRQMALVDSIVGGLVGFVIVWLPFHHLYRLVRGQPGMGLGDAKLLALTGAWFGWKGAVFALLAGAVQGTVVAIAVLVAKGRIEEPESVRREREELALHLEGLPAEERAALEAELAGDPLRDAPESGFGKARIPFGPFLALSTIEFLFVGEALVDAYWSMAGGG